MKSHCVISLPSAVTTLRKCTDARGPWAHSKFEEAGDHSGFFLELPDIGRTWTRRYPLVHALFVISDAMTHRLRRTDPSISRRDEHQVLVVVAEIGEL